MGNKPLEFPFGIYTNDNTPVDGKYYNRSTGLPYTNMAEALAILPVGVRYPGMIINIGYQDYWWPSDDTDITKQPVQKTSQALNANHADLADYALDADKWDGRQFSDYLNQPVRTTDDVRFKSLTSTNYVSGALGSGFKIDENGDAVFDNLTVRKQFNVYELVLNKISGTNGALAVTDTIKIDTVTETSTGYDCTIDTGGNTIAVPFQVDDLLRCQVWNGTGLKYYFAKVTAVGNGTFTIDKASKVGAGVPASGDTVVRFGNTSNVNRQGLLYLTASDTNAPYLDVLDGVTSDNLAGKTKVRLGRLDGITDADLGNLSGYGLYGQNVFVKGKIHVTGGNAETVTGSQSKADTAQNNAVNTASADATAKANAAQSAAQSYAAAQAAYEREIAKAYADGIVTAEEQARITQAAANLQNAKDDAQQKVNAAIASANGYTDTKALATISAAQSYADNSAQTKANAAQANAISQASTDAQNKANAAQANAAVLSQQLIDNLKLGGRNYFGLHTGIDSDVSVSRNGNILTIIGNQQGLGFVRLINVIKDDGFWTVSFKARVNSDFYLSAYLANGEEHVFGITTEWQEFSFTSNAHTSNGAFTNVYFYKIQWVSLEIKDIKVEKGTKATDWTPAPEDVQAAIDNAKALVDAANASYATLTASLKSMAYKDVEEFATEFGSTIIENGKVKTTLLDADYIKSNIVNAAYINALDIDAGAIKSGTIDSARINASQIVVNGGGATQSYANNVASIAQANAIATASADAQDKADQAQANAQAMVEAIKVGGRNYVIGSDVYSTSDYSFDSSEVQNWRGKTITVSVDIEIVNATGTRIGFEPGISFEDGTVLYAGAWHWVTQGESIKRRITGTYNVPDKPIAGLPQNGVYIQCQGTLTKVGRPKVELGSKATDWTPAPEDVDQAVADAKTAGELAQAQNAALTASLKSMAYKDEVAVEDLGSTIIEGGKIKTTLLDALAIRANMGLIDYLQASELVTKNLKTATIGKRVEIDSVNNNIRVLDAANKVLIEIDDDSALISFNASGQPIYGAGMMIGDVASDYMSLSSVNIQGTGNIIIGGYASFGKYVHAVNLQTNISNVNGSLPDTGLAIVTGNCNLYTYPDHGQLQTIKNRASGNITVSAAESSGRNILTTGNATVFSVTLAAGAVGRFQYYQPDNIWIMI